MGHTVEVLAHTYAHVISEYPGRGPIAPEALITRALRRERPKAHHQQLALLKPTGELEPPTPSFASVSHVTPSNAEPAFIGHLVGARRHRGREASTRGTPNGRHARRADRRVGASRGLRRGHADALAQRPDCRRPPSQGAGWVVRFDLGDGPTEGGELAGNGDGDQGAVVSRRSIRRHVPCNRCCALQQIATAWWADRPTNTAAR
jgi:hypothetical protein